MNHHNARIGMPQIMGIADFKAGLLANSPDQGLDLALAVRPLAVFLRVAKQKIHMAATALFQAFFSKVGYEISDLIHQKAGKINKPGFTVDRDAIMYQKSE